MAPTAPAALAYLKGLAKAAVGGEALDPAEVIRACLAAQPKAKRKGRAVDADVTEAAKPKTRPRRFWWFGCRWELSKTKSHRVCLLCNEDLPNRALAYSRSSRRCTWDGWVRICFDCAGRIVVEPIGSEVINVPE